jgi:hypothetical protein
VSRTTRILLLAIPIVLTVAVLGYAVVATVQVQRGNQTASSPAPTEASTGTTQPLNPDAPTVVAQTLEPTNSGAKRGTIIFDMAHSEVFGPQDPSELGQSKAVERMRAAGYAVRIITEKISKETLTEDVAAVYLPGPMVPLTDQERTSIDDFVRRGGTMVMTVHVPFPIMGTPTRYGLPVGTGVMVVPGVTPDPGVWATSEIKKDPVTRGVKMLSVVSGWPVSVSPSEIADPRIVIEAPKSVVVDGNGDNAFDASDPQPPYGVVGVATIGSGRVVVLGDDAIFANIAIDTNDNAKFLDNLLDLISSPRPA